MKNIHTDDEMDELLSAGPDDIDRLLQEEEQKLSNLKAGKAAVPKVAKQSVPGTKGPSIPRVSNGKMVAFYNKKGQLITGLATEYWVARMDGKLHYKEASQVTFLPEGWQQGDPIPGMESKVPDMPSFDGAELL